MPANLLLSGGHLDTSCPVDWSHPLNAGRVLWLLGHPQPGWTGGSVWWDLVGLSAKTGNDGTLTNGPTWAATPRGDMGLILNGSTQKVSLGAFRPHANNQVTVAVWLNPAVTSRGDLVTAWLDGVHTDDSFNLLYGLTAGKPQFFVTNGSSTGNSGVGSTAMTVGTWNRVVGTYDGTVVSVYLNGVLQASASVSLTMPTGGTRTVWVGNNDAGDGATNGTIAEPTLINRAWSAAEVALDYDLSQRGYPGVLRRVRPWSTGTTVTGGTTYNVTAADSPSTSDAVVRLGTFGRTAGDSPQTSDSVAKVLALLRTAGDAPQTIDSVTRLLTLLRTVGDSPQTIDSVVRLLTLARTASDNPTVTSTSATRLLTLLRTAADNPQTVDSPTRLLTLARTAGDTPSTTDAPTYQAGKIRTAGDNPQTADSAPRVLTLGRSAGDGPNTVDTPTRLLTLHRTAGDAASTADAPTYQTAKTRTASDAASTTDAVAKQLAFLRTANDLPATADTAVRRLNLLRFVADGPYTTDSASIGAPVVTANSGPIVGYRPRVQVISFQPRTQVIRGR